MKFYHGSQAGDIEMLEPRLDPRLGIKGVFVGSEPFGPSMFALLKDRPNSILKYEIKNGRFIRGGVYSPMPLSESGWLYEVEPNDSEVVERSPGRFYINSRIKISGKVKINKWDVLSIGWRIFDSLDEFRDSDLADLLEGKS